MADLRDDMNRILASLMKLEALEKEDRQFIRNKHIKEYTSLIGELNKMGYRYLGNGKFEELD